MRKTNFTSVFLILLFPVILLSQKATEKIDLRSYFDYNTNSPGFHSINYYDTIIFEKKSPTGAMLRSAIIPGLGQFYNESYWKIPVIYGVAAFFAYEYKINNDEFKKYSDKYEAIKNIDDDYTQRTATFYKNNREFYRDNRDSYIWYFSLLYILNILDAYVDAHLFDFNVNEDYQYRSIPGSYSIRFKINF